MKVPSWLCSVICASLNIDELYEEANQKVEPRQSKYYNDKFDIFTSENTEESNILNVNSNKSNSFAWKNSH